MDFQLIINIIFYKYICDSFKHHLSLIKDIFKHPHKYSTKKIPDGTANLLNETSAMIKDEYLYERLLFYCFKFNTLNEVNHQNIYNITPIGELIIIFNEYFRDIFCKFLLYFYCLII